MEVNLINQYLKPNSKILNLGYEDSLKVDFIKDQFDVITLDDIANLSDNELGKIYHKCYNLLSHDSVLLTSQQHTKTDDSNCLRLIRRAGFEVEIIDTSDLKVFVCKKGPPLVPYSEYFSWDRVHDEKEWFAMYKRRETSIRSNEDKWKLLQTVKMYLDANDIPFYLMFGTLLGAVRDKDFIAWDGDVDIAILGRFQNRLLTFVDNIIPFKLLRIIDKYYCSLVHNDEFIDIYTYTEEEKKYSWCGGLNRYFDEEKDILDNPSKIVFKNEEFLTVKNPAESLTRWYGPDWLTPKKTVQEWKIH